MLLETHVVEVCACAVKNACGAKTHVVRSVRALLERMIVAQKHEHIRLFEYAHVIKALACYKSMRSCKSLISNMRLTCALYYLSVL